MNAIHNTLFEISRAEMAVILSEQYRVQQWKKERTELFNYSDLDFLDYIKAKERINQKWGYAK